MLYLMIKKCMKTGLMYLCKTASVKAANDELHPYKYKGSGVRWQNHIKKHNSWIVTCVIGVYNTKEELQQAGLYYSGLYNVVKSSNWANLTEEKGDGGLIGTGQLGKHWKIKDTSNMSKPKTKTVAWYEAREKITGKKNYQFKGLIKTPWGVFDSSSAAGLEGQRLREAGNHAVITDGATLRKYLNNLDTALSSEGRRTPTEWRGKTPRELGFAIIKEETNGKD